MKDVFLAGSLTHKYFNKDEGKMEEMTKYGEYYPKVVSNPENFIYPNPKVEKPFLCLIAALHIIPESI